MSTLSQRRLQLLLKGADLGAQGVDAQQERSLKELLQGRAEEHDMAKQAETAKQARAEIDYKHEAARAARQNTIDDAIAVRDRLDAGGRGKRYNINLSPDGGVALSEAEANPLASLLVQQRRERQNEQDLTKLGERVAKSNIPMTNAALENLETGTASKNRKGEEVGGILTNPKYKVKSAGPIANYLPQWAKNVGESVGLMPKGSQEEAALIQRLFNVDIRNFSGTAVTAYEQGRQMIEKGMSAGGDPDLVRLGLRQMYDAATALGINLEASTRPEILEQFRAQGGRTSYTDQTGKKAYWEQGSAPPSSAGMAPPQSDAAKLRAELEARRQKARQGH